MKIKLDLIAQVFVSERISKLVNRIGRRSVSIHFTRFYASGSVGAVSLPLTIAFLLDSGT